MAGFRRCCALIVSLLLFGTPAWAAEQAPAAPSSLYDQPVLIIDPGMHTATIAGAAVDAAGRWAVTGSHDKTVRVWSLADGSLLRTIRLPSGPGPVGKVYTVAVTSDGALIGASGWTRRTDADAQEQIYLFDRERGNLVYRISGLPSAALKLVFSPRNDQIAAVLSRGNGLRLYGRQRSWTEIARDDQNYGDRSNGVVFAPDGRLVTSGYDGKVRLYTGRLEGNIQPSVVVATQDGTKPFDLAFTPDGRRLAVGFADRGAVTVMEGRSLTRLLGIDLRDVGYYDAPVVSWSQNGQVLFAAGRHASESSPVVGFGKSGAGEGYTVTFSQQTVNRLVAVPGGDLLVAAADPWLARLRADGEERWEHRTRYADLRGQFDSLSVSNDGTLIEFGFQSHGEAPAWFDVSTLTLGRDPPLGRQTIHPDQKSLSIAGWLNGTRPSLNGQILSLDSYETSRSLAVHAPSSQFVIGTEWKLRAFDGKAVPLWQRDVPGVVWAVNITGHGRLVTAAYGDGTIRWHRMSDGVELLAFMPLADRTNWVAWTPEGFYAATAGAHGVLRWHVNRGWDQPADSVAIEDIPGSRRPAVLHLVLQELETPRALGLAVLAEHKREVALRTNSKIPPGAKLHLLAVGISAYNEDYAKHLRLNYAARDAHDLASAITNTQGSLYAGVSPQVLLDKDAGKAGILRALATMRVGMEKGTGNDLAVVHFSGHGALIDGKLYLMPYDVDARDPVAITANGLSIDQFRGALAELAKHGRVLVLLDACHSGATTMNGTDLAMNSTDLRQELAIANVTVLTSSSGSEVSREDSAWGHGAFTKTLLDAFNDPAADINRNGLITTTGLAHYVTTRVGSLTQGKQTPGMEVRFGTTVFASGM